MPRKVRGRPVTFGPAQLRALDTFLREQYLQDLSGDDIHLLSDGRAFHEEGTAFFDADHLHVEFLKTHRYKVSARQLTLALSEIGVHSVQRRFGNGTRRRVHTVPVPEGTYCCSSAKEDADYWRLRSPGWVGPVEAEPWIAAREQYDLHGVTRAAVRFVRANIEQYPEPERARAVQALANDKPQCVEEFFDQLKVEHFSDLGGYKVNFWRPLCHSKSEMDQAFPYDYYETFSDSLFDASLFEAPDKVKYLLTYSPDATPFERLQLLARAKTIGRVEKSKVVILLQHLPEVGGAYAFTPATTELRALCSPNV